MRRTIALLFAIVLVMGMTQCKKKADTIANVGGEKIQITLDVDGGKHVINPGTSGQVAYEEGDVIYVGDGSRFIGTLTHNGTKFVGGVNTPVGDKLHFYFIGGFTPSPTPTQGSTTSFTVNISDQRSNLPVLSYASVSYVPGQSAYTCMLKNKCALVNFKLTEGTSSAVTLNSVPTIATVNFSTPGITSTGTTGNITLNSESTTSKWAILLPMATATNTNVTIGSNNYDVEVPIITANDYLHDATAIEINNVDYVFSVSSTKTVHFSPGNLQYKPSDGSWKFAANQYDIIGAANANISPSYDGWLDLFGWGTGDNPIKGYDDNSYNSTFNDWGDYCGDPTGNGYKWSTLTKDEWQYILGHSTKGWSTVAGVKGYVIRPDGNTTPVASSYTAEAWADEEALGSVFLPVAGYRLGSGVNEVGYYGYYWSSTPCGENSAWDVSFGAPGASMSNLYRYYGCSVRLVR